MTMRNSNSRLGFTLVELLVVIGIIAVLVSILLPSLNKARAQAQTVQCASNLKQIGIAYRLYGEEFHGLVPLVCGGQWGATLPNGDQLYWYRALAPYLAKNIDPLTMDVSKLPAVIKACPAWSSWMDTSISSNQWRPGYGQNTYMWCGNYQPKRVPKGTLNYQDKVGVKTAVGTYPQVGIMPYDGTLPNTTNEWVDAKTKTLVALSYNYNLGSFKLNSVKDPQNRILAGDSDEYWLGVTQDRSSTYSAPKGLEYDFLRLDVPADKNNGYFTSNVKWNGGHPLRHGGNFSDCPPSTFGATGRARANYLFCDGHVVTLDYVAARKAMQAP